jgi:hypothetical protein
MIVIKVGLFGSFGIPWCGGAYPLAWLDATEAEVETRFGNTRKALQLIHHGEAIFATEEPRPSPAWLDWFSPVRLAGFKGNTLLTAKQQHGPARDTLQNVLEHLPEESAKQRSVFLGDLAAVAVAVAENNPDDACTLAEEARPPRALLVRNRNGPHPVRPRIPHLA